MFRNERAPEFRLEEKPSAESSFRASWVNCWWEIFNLVAGWFIIRGFPRLSESSSYLWQRPLFSIIWVHWTFTLSSPWLCVVEGHVGSWKTTFKTLHGGNSPESSSKVKTSGCPSFRMQNRLQRLKKRKKATHKTSIKWVIQPLFLQCAQTAASTEDLTLPAILYLSSCTTQICNHQSAFNGESRICCRNTEA